MNRTLLNSVLSLTLISAGSAAAQPTQEPGWRGHLTAASMVSTSGGSAQASLGFGLGLEYRASRRLGFALSAANAELENEFDIEFFDLVSLTLESQVRATPILAQLDLHLTPERRIDLFVGPVVGYVLYGDQELRIRGAAEGEPVGATFREPTEDGFAWGAHLGINAPLGSSNAYFTARATYLKADVEAAAGDEELEARRFDLDPVVVQVGIGYRF